MHKLLQLIVLSLSLSYVAEVIHAQSFAYITNQTVGTVSVIDISTKNIVKTIAVGSYPFGVTVSPDGSHAYVGNQGTRDISVIDTSTHTVVDTIEIEFHPSGSLAVTPDSDFVYVASGVLLAVIDTSTNRVIENIKIAEGPLPARINRAGIAVSPDGRRVYVTNNNGAVSVVETVTNLVVETINLGTLSDGVSLAPDGSYLYVASPDTVSVIDTLTNSLVRTIAVGVRPSGIAVAPAGDFIYVANNSSNTLSVIDTFSNVMTATIDVGIRPFGVAVTPDGDYIFVANHGSNSVSIIDSLSNAVVDTVSVGDGPVAFGNFISPDPTVCRRGPTVLCLRDRFKIEVDWQDFAGSTGEGQILSTTSRESGLFWFFNSDNLEILVKVLNGCDINDYFWVFISAATNLEYDLKITDVKTGIVNHYANPLGTVAETIIDTSGFAVCP